eukprot:Blabericola_migrator_1__761@NODE_118_length_13653_cov_35_432504_g106_i0_p7_GENE_NODE_118_length_13653_cov_35_432504_g106_i0NODE_118_length_13653_cov_35_432504_g106_i0_p7_ORF_typecomplete_len141_score21_07_NODE_118_length_13653_cov_35_432504_g106_i0571993
MALSIGKSSSLFARSYFRESPSIEVNEDVLLTTLPSTTLKSEATSCGRGGSHIYDSFTKSLFTSGGISEVSIEFNPVALSTRGSSPLDASHRELVGCRKESNGMSIMSRAPSSQQSCGSKMSGKSVTPSAMRLTVESPIA